MNDQYSSYVAATGVSNLVASLTPVSKAPCTVEKWFVLVASPANKTRGFPAASSRGLPRFFLASGFSGVSKPSKE